jgi:hypothetical protein
MENKMNINSSRAERHERIIPEEQQSNKYEEKLQALAISFYALIVMFIAAVAWNIGELIINNL